MGNKKFSLPNSSSNNFVKIMQQSSASSIPMDKYRLVGEKSNKVGPVIVQDKESVNICEVRITQQGKPRNYISFAMNVFANGSEQIVLNAMGRAINKAVTIAEILKRKMPLHQVNRLTSTEIVDIFEPLEEGLDVVESKRYVSCMTITLSLTKEGVDAGDIGYQKTNESREYESWSDKLDKTDLSYYYQA